MSAISGTRIAPWIGVPDGNRALAFYTAAFGATVLHRLEKDDRIQVAQLVIGEAEF
jgi:uncharacterized glyoxalase superfamily protein PhnB